MSETKRLGQVGFERYGNVAGIAGPWKTFDGRDMPKWDALQGDAGQLTQVRWEEAALAIIAEARPYLLRGEDPPGYRWDDLAKRYVQTGSPKGRAIMPRTTGA
jgi:hypothetical protein